MKNIKGLLDTVDKVRDHVALGLMSDPGLSKTSQVKQWCEENGRNYYELIISQRMPSEISGMPMPVSDTKKMEIFDFDTLLQLEDGDVLAFDEFTNGNIQTLNACLTLIQERTMLSGRKLPSILVVAMGNPQGRCDLLPQTKQRFWWVDVVFDRETWKNYMFDTWKVDVPREVLRVIGDQYSQGFDFDEYNYFTPRTIENLYRIAMEVDEDDVFWKVSPTVSPDLKRLIYGSLAQDSDLIGFHAVFDQWSMERILIAESREEEDEPEIAGAVMYLKSRFNEARNLRQLARVITDLEGMLEDPSVLVSPVGRIVISEYLELLKEVDDPTLPLPEKAVS